MAIHRRNTSSFLGEPATCSLFTAASYHLCANLPAHSALTSLARRVFHPRRLVNHTVSIQIATGILLHCSLASECSHLKPFLNVGTKTSLKKGCFKQSNRDTWAPTSEGISRVRNKAMLLGLRKESQHANGDILADTCSVNNAVPFDSRMWQLFHVGVEAEGRLLVVGKIDNGRAWRKPVI